MLSCLFTSLHASHAALAAPWDILTEDVDWTGYIKNETAYRYREPRSFTKIRNILYLHGNLPFGRDYELTAAGWAYYDLAYDLFDYDTISARAERDFIQPLNFISGLEQREDSGVAEFRELYLDVFLDRADIRIGKQFVVWGVLTGVRIVDEVNPMDFRELILPDLLDYRIPLWTFRLDYYGDETTYQFLWIPDLEFHKPAPPGSEWELLQEVPGTTYPEESFENSEWGFRVSRHFWDTDFQFSYLYTWDDFPVIFRESVFEATPNSPDTVFFPTYTQIHMYGMTLQRPFLGQVLKGELAYVKDKYFGITGVDRDGDNIVDNEGELQKDHLRWGVGIDFNWLKTDFSLGLMQWIIFKYQPEIIQDQVDSSVNVFVRKPLPQQGAVFSLLGIWLINLEELYLKPKLTFDVSDRFQVAVGMDLFRGQKSQTGVGAEGGRPVDVIELEQRFQFIGNFEENDRLFFEFKYGF